MISPNVIDIGFDETDLCMDKEQEKKPDDRCLL